MKEIDIGELLKNKFADFEQTPPDDMWEKIIQNEKVLKYNKAYFVKRAILYSATAVFVVAVVSLLLYLTIGIDDKSTLVSDDNNSLNKVNNTESVFPNDSNSKTFNKETIVETPSEPSHIQNGVVNENKSVPLSNENSVKLAPIIKSTIPKTYTQSRNISEIVSPAVSYSNENSIHPDNKVVKKDSGQDEIVTSRENSDNDQQVNTNPVEPPQSDLANYNLFIPKGFTPNGDGLNDLFLVYSSFDVQNFEFSIFDQSGRLLFKSKDISFGWDGESYGQKMKAGSYVYIISYKDITGKSHLEKGQVTLIR